MSCDVYQKLHFLVCAVLVSYAPFVCEHGRLGRAYHGYAVNKNAMEIALQEAPDVPLSAGEGLPLDFAGTRPKQKCARFDLEISGSFSGGQPIGVRCVGRNFG